MSGRQVFQGHEKFTVLMDQQHVRIVVDQFAQRSIGQVRWWIAFVLCTVVFAPKFVGEIIGNAPWRRGRGKGGRRGLVDRGHAVFIAAAAVVVVDAVAECIEITVAAAVIDPTVAVALVGGIGFFWFVVHDASLKIISDGVPSQCWNRVMKKGKQQVFTRG